MLFPDELRYTPEHEWLRLDGGEVTVGITDFAQDSLGDVVYVDLPDVGATFERNASCAEVESTKSVSEIYAPISGAITATNELLSDQPELINTDPYGEGWIVRIALAEPAEMEQLLDAPAYRALVE